MVLAYTSHKYFLLLYLLWSDSLVSLWNPPYESTYHNICTFLFHYNFIVLCRARNPFGQSTGPSADFLFLWHSIISWKKVIFLRTVKKSKCKRPKRQEFLWDKYRGAPDFIGHADSVSIGSGHFAPKAGRGVTSRRFFSASCIYIGFTYSLWKYGSRYICL